uniref:EF-hand domain-containing protein n=1 Tax=Laticauda laticaudata TaxID=8630 RepID=A0A8C5SYC3_LATLA
MAGLVDSICTIIAVFHKYFGIVRSRVKLGRLVQSPSKIFVISGFSQNPRDPQIVKLTFQLLDVNGDNCVDFNEFLFFIFEMATRLWIPWPSCGIFDQEANRFVCSCSLIIFNNTIFSHLSQPFK